MVATEKPAGEDDHGTGRLANPADRAVFFNATAHASTSFYPEELRRPNGKFGSDVLAGCLLFAHRWHDRYRVRVLASRNESREEAREGKQ